LFAVTDSGDTGNTHFNKEGMKALRLPLITLILSEDYGGTAVYVELKHCFDS
jgi:hypothetical protein